MKHHAAKKLEQIDGSSLQCCFASGLQLLLLLLEEQPGHRYAWTTAERALYERRPGGQATWLAEASVLPEQHTVAVQQGAVPVLWLVRELWVTGVQLHLCFQLIQAQLIGFELAAWYPADGHYLPCAA